MSASPRRLRAIDPARDHVRGGSALADVVSIVSYADFLCPYCHRLRQVLRGLRQVFARLEVGKERIVLETAGRLAPRRTASAGR